jgi:hypothetical protein
MHSLSHTPAATADPAEECARLAALLEERRAELAALQESLREFKARYARTVGARLAELAELEREIRRAEARALGVGEEEEEGEPPAAQAAGDGRHVKGTLRGLFWAVAKMFHPDHAADESEARRRHAVMAEASRAYREGDVESLNTLLGDEDLQLYCATPRASDDAEEEDLTARLLKLREELLTIEFGLKRARQDRLYQIKLQADAESAAGRDQLAAESERIARQIVKARRRLAHFS